MIKAFDLETLRFLASTIRRPDAMAQYLSAQLEFLDERICSREDRGEGGITAAEQEEETLLLQLENFYSFVDELNGRLEILHGESASETPAESVDEGLDIIKKTVIMPS